MNFQKLSYRQGIALMSFLNMDEAGNTVETSIFRPEPYIEIRYPGSKKGLGDYKAYFDLQGSGELKAYSHSEICDLIYKIVKPKPQKYNIYLNILQDIYKEGLACSDKYLKTPKRLKLIKLLYWATLQEEINYPCGNGRKLAFYRYAEALGSCDPQNDIKIEDVISRADYRGQSRLPSLKIADPPTYYLEYMNS